jgi:hypothetical protein
VITIAPRQHHPECWDPGHESDNPARDGEKDRIAGVDVRRLTGENQLLFP